MSWTGNSMNNLLSYCGLVDARIIASEKDLPVLDEFNCSRDFWSQHFLKDFKNSPIDTMKLYHRSWSVKAKLLQESSLFNEPISFPGFLRGLRWGFPNSKLVPRSPKEGNWFLLKITYLKRFGFRKSLARNECRSEVESSCGEHFDDLALLEWK